MCAAVGCGHVSGLRYAQRHPGNIVGLHSHAIRAAKSRTGGSSRRSSSDASDAAASATLINAGETRTIVRRLRFELTGRLIAPRSAAEIRHSHPREPASRSSRRS